MIVLNIAGKDLKRLLRDRMTFLFTLFMPAAITLLFGFAFGGFGPAGDSRLPVGWLDQDGSPVSGDLRRVLDGSQLMRLVELADEPAEATAQRVGDGDLAAALIVPPGFGESMKKGRGARPVLIADTGASAGMSIESEALAALIHIESALRTAAALEDYAGQSFDAVYADMLAAWDDPPVRVEETDGAAAPVVNEMMARTSPGFMLQFAIAGLLVSAQIMVNDRRTRCLARMLTTSARRMHILLGHFLAVFTLICLQFTLLIAYGQFLLRVNYLHAPAATALIAVTAAGCIAGLGLVIGVAAKTEDQAVTFALVPMFLLAGLGGAWVPLEVTGETFRLIGHLSPVAWGMDGFTNVTIRGLGLRSALLPAAVLASYAALFFALAAWRFRRLEER